ncbi:MULTISPECIES: UDP-glucose 4-epimerase GalE [Achromobacter]|uniref:UDP-glucose 4-epimerase n=1 Tax=Alcaligenes xylosoxydans xylosoxydans TaxID=85698 RepID=A0A424W943_ALCXX|nr:MULTISPECIES: UDP-glucose 4-epimerase GalE [Achromobacter]MBC9906802.1 UDP-glucose 4-epimerase GalE [Achromobacter xylosoxidans]MBD0870534.1 UDP-glucose 4-epimerase GalE [Achromobacter xylosoxidans]QNP85750.1 UDP-glucose 4-epimerase GalE [Achromobacter xylosoxidans]RPJ89745.1 UDP-glucose 4-epimerase GalE [Achromobacter xylosoxidans]
MNQKLLVTGGAGYIGSHTLLALLRSGFTPIVLDNFSNSSPEVLRRVEALAGVALEVVSGDICDAALLDRIFATQRDLGTPVSTVVHFAALKAVGESVEQPLHYYANNVGGTITLLAAMDRAEVRNMVFSSSATVYGEPICLPYTEDHRIAPTNPYGWSKAVVEQILKDWAHIGGGRCGIALRYFNPIGAHESGTIGEAPSGIPNNLFPYITQVAVGKRERLAVFGDDYETVDGTGVRDYLHVDDLAEGHVKAVDVALKGHAGFTAVNLGTGRGTSVLQLVAAFEQASGRSIPYEVMPRRAGDIASAWANPELAHRLLGWRAERTIEQMCVDGWRWQSQNPKGYEG